MTYPGSRSHTWVAGERVDDTVLNAWAPPNVAWGNTVAPTSASPTNSGISTSLVDATGVTVAFNALTGRRYKITLQGTYRWSTTGASNEYAELQIRDSGLVKAGNGTRSNDTDQFDTITVIGYVTPSTGAVSYKASIAVVGGSTGRLALGGVWTICAEDIGPTTP